MKRLITSFALGLISASFGSFAAAQSLTTGAITGTVLDQSGAVMSSVVVTAKNVDTGATRETQTTGSGDFLFAQLDPGRYKLVAESNGFKKTEMDPVTVSVGRIATVRLKLLIGSPNEQIVVHEGAQIVEPSNPNTATTFNSTQLSNIPNPGSDLTYVANLTPGAVMNVSQGGGLVAGKVEFNGLPSLANDFTVDGLDANDIVRRDNFTGARGLQLGLNAIQEVSVNTSSYLVPGGRSSGSEINFLKKTG